MLTYVVNLRHRPIIMKRFLHTFAWLFLLSPGIIPADVAGADEATDQALAAVRSVGAEGSGFEAAIPAAKQLRTLSPSQITTLLDAMEGVNPIAENWLRGVVFDLARKADGPTVAELSQYAMDRSHNPIGRGLAMELIRRQAAGEANTLIAKCLDDPSLPLREMAVEQAMEQAKEFADAKEAAAAKRRYREALTAARHPRQLSRIVEALGKLGDQVKTAEAFSMITQWNCLAPLDNVDGVGFDTAYPVETRFAETGTVDLSATYQGKTDPIEWKSVQASDEGVVDLAAAYNKEKGAVAYLYTEFDSPEELPAQLRLGCTNANKAWLNGRQIMANKVYHSGSMIDQYIANCDLKKGTNRILLKICQNEQTEPWAQEWELQFRITDRAGKGLRSGQ
jgi:hypothetical protein